MSDDWKLAEAKELNAPEWMLSVLLKNPEYICWDLHQPDMAAKGDAWDSPLTIDSWQEFDYEPDNYNEIVNFYFDVEETEQGEPSLALRLWMIHPRKSGSRGITVKNIQESEIPEVIEYLKKARDRNQEKFSLL